MPSASSVAPSLFGELCHAPLHVRCGGVFVFERDAKECGRAAAWGGRVRSGCPEWASGEGFRVVSSGCADATARCEEIVSLRKVFRYSLRQGLLMRKVPLDSAAMSVCTAVPRDSVREDGRVVTRGAVGFGGGACLLRKVPLDLAAMSVCANRDRAIRGGAKAVCGGAFPLAVGRLLPSGRSIGRIPSTRRSGFRAAPSASSATCGPRCACGIRAGCSACA